jgi:hypothetical protein
MSKIKEKLLELEDMSKTYMNSFSAIDIKEATNRGIGHGMNHSVKVLGPIVESQHLEKDEVINSLLDLAETFYTQADQLNNDKHYNDLAYKACADSIFDLAESLNGKDINLEDNKNLKNTRKYRK